ncbi:Sodium/calcium exchanger protein-domain-containing protein [Podospora appendiculata]|uniref:Sodium/calcium exchanger protein-domain-containing protein n=1 Tax=Podospora appendiculata TaxID=314037 RepID=A0AAE0X9L1_9PEZI|nr:Sodium/calcium exchanger protein-domain-containing protein [Podospora appendiculata]
MASLVNAFKIKRAAHSLSRQDSSWNPFSHTYRDQRTQTWGGGAQRGADDDIEAGSPIAHAHTAPELGDSVGEGRNFLGSRKDTNVPDAERSQPDSGDTFIESEPTPSAGSSVRRRLNNKDSNAGPIVDGSDDAGKLKKKKTGIFKHVEPKTPFTVGNQIRRTVFNSWINILLVAAPVGIAINYVPSVPRVAVFVINFIAIIPLAAMLSFATEEIALRTGESLGGLLNATFGNAVELIIAIIALVKDEVVIVQTSLIGSILSNLLLVMGMCFFFGGLRRQEQFFNTTVAQTAASLLALAVAGVIVPTVFDMASNTPQADVAKLSRGTAIILLLVYGGYLFFQLHTHSSVFAEESQKVEARPHKSALPEGAIAQGLVGPAGVMGGHGLPSGKEDTEKLRRLLNTPPKPLEGEEEEGEEPQLHFIVALATLGISTVIIAFCAEYMVSGISAITDGGHVSAEFVGLILLPIVGNAAEHATAVTVAIKDKMDLAIGVAVGSSMQVALFIIPLLVVIGWGMGMDDMTLSFDVFQVAVLFVAVLLVNYLIADGKSHWLEGMLLVCLYLIIAVCSWWYPAKEGVAAE